MNAKISRLIAFFYYTLFFLVPIILWPKTSEVFEFNKMVLTYFLTVSIISAWAAKMILQKKFLFRRTILDIPLLIFLGAQALSTLTSIDFRTSLLGYYSRFNGGLLSNLSYALLYWAYVSNMDRGKTLKGLYILLGSAVLVSIYGVLEHFGIDKDLWVQDVQNRVFSTLGQPNWLAAWLAALIPITWAFALKSKLKINISKPYLITKNFWPYIILSALFLLTLLYTKSRSGILGFIISYLVFWGGIFALRKESVKPFFRKFLFISSSLLVISLAVGTPWTPSLAMLRQPPTINDQLSTIQGPALEVGGTESGEIRKIVWRGAIEIWKRYPVLGTGPETFAFAYYMARPVEHNLVSEWDFLYNKAHNEYLNYAANSGTLGLLSYLFLIASTIYLFLKLESVAKTNRNLTVALLSGYVSILVSNFFGFSVVPTAIQFFLFPAMAVGLLNKQHTTNNFQLKKLGDGQKAAIVVPLLVGGWLLLVIARYWYADLLFAEARFLNDQAKFVEARGNLISATGLSSNEATFYSELAQSDAGIALALDNAGEKVKSKDFVDAAISESDMAVSLSPANLNLRRNRASVFIRLSALQTPLVKLAKDVLLEATAMAPTDAKLFYNLGLTYARIGDVEAAIKTLKKTIELKPNYRDARLAYALILIDEKRIPEAREELKYILEKINPNDTIARNQLEEIK